LTRMTSIVVSFCNSPQSLFRLSFSLFSLIFTSICSIISISIDHKSVEFSHDRVNCRQHNFGMNYTTSQNASLCATFLDISCSRQFESKNLASDSWIRIPPRCVLQPLLLRCVLQYDNNLVSDVRTPEMRYAIIKPSRCVLSSSSSSPFARLEKKIRTGVPQRGFSSRRKWNNESCVLTTTDQSML
jgi:hypothetical protein